MGRNILITLIFCQHFPSLDCAQNSSHHFPVQAHVRAPVTMAAVPADICLSRSPVCTDARAPVKGGGVQ